MAARRRPEAAAQEAGKGEAVEESDRSVVGLLGTKTRGIGRALLISSADLLSFALCNGPLVLPSLSPPCSGALCSPTCPLTPRPGPGSRAGHAPPPALRSPLKGLNAARAGAKPAGAGGSRIWVVSEDELSQEIISDITVHEQEIHALRNEMALLKERRGRLREAWGGVGRLVVLDDDGMQNQADTHVDNDCCVWQEQAEVPRVADAREPDSDDEIETLKRNIEILRETDRQRQIEVEEQVGRWRMEADESVRIAEEMRYGTSGVATQNTHEIMTQCAHAIHEISWRLKSHD